MKFAAKDAGYEASDMKTFDMAAQLFSKPLLATFSRVALSIALALAVPQMIVAAAPPAAGTAHAFLVWL